MSMPEPGSWIAECRCGDWLVVQEGAYAVAYPDPCRGDQAETIACLIAVAPELLEIARSLIANIDEWDGDPLPGQRWHKEYTAAKCALAKVGA